MSNIGILCPGAIGHLNPMCNLGMELIRRGHKITLFGVPEVAEKIARSNLEFCEIGASDFPPGSIETMYAQLVPDGTNSHMIRIELERGRNTNYAKT